MKYDADQRAAHPARIGQCAWWHGIEVEGCHAGRPVAVIAEALGHDESAKAVQWIHDHNAVVFIADSFNAWDWLRVLLRSTEVPVCVGRMLDDIDTVPEDIRAATSLVVRVFDPRLRTLRDGDQVCVGVPFDLETFVVGAGVKTKPADYLADVGTK